MNALPHTRKWILFMGLAAGIITGCMTECMYTYAAEAETMMTDEMLDDIDYDGLNEALEDAFETDELDFGELMKRFASGDFSFDMDFLKELLDSGVFGNINGLKSIFIQILALSVISALFSVVSSIFGNGQIAEICFYVVYLTLKTLLLKSFVQAAAIASGTIEKLLAFVKVMMPAYLLIVAAAGGQTTAVAFYEFFLFLVFAVDWLFIKVLLPLIQVYAVLGIVNHITKEDLFSKTAELLRTVIIWAMKSLVGLVIGFQVLQSLVTPFIDSFKTASIHKTLMSIPGLGNAIDSVTEMAIGAGILIKNGMGAAALVVILLICLTPVATLGIYVLLYQLARALIQPVADTRIVKSIGYVKEGTRLLLRTVFISCALFLLTIAVLTATTNSGI